MLYLTFGLILFFSVHCVSIVNEQWRDQIVSKISIARWKGLYTLFALLGFALICWGWSHPT